MKKDLAIIAGLFVLIAILLVFGQGFTSLRFLTADGGIGQGISSDVTIPSRVNVTIKNLTIDAEAASTPASRKKGLSKKDSVPFNQGMLFVFDNPGQYGIWMKDMRFAIDILWLDEDKKVVDIAVDVPPQQDKRDSELTIYKPSHNSKYVLEVNAGLVRLNSIQVGDQAFFNL